MTSFQHKKCWYVVQTKPQKEENVHQLFIRGGFEAFYPRIKIFGRGQSLGKKASCIERIKPLFPSYLFIQLSSRDDDDLRTVRYTRGVNKILGGLNGPVTIETGVIETIRSRIGEKGFIEQGLWLKPGDKVMVKRGVLKDLIGVLEKPMDDKGRVGVLLKIVHHSMRAKIYCADLEKIE